MPENATRFAAWREPELERLRAAGLATTELLAAAVDLWRKNKPDATKWPHVSDLNVFAYLLGGWLEVQRGRASIKVTPGRLAELEIEHDPEGPHLLGGEVSEAKGAELRQLFMARILAPPREL